jgi:hypothetical protein
MFVGCISRGKSIAGYINKGLVETHNIRHRHDELAKVMVSRGMKHNSPLDYADNMNVGYVHAAGNICELSRRCSVCRELIEGMIK